MKTKNYDLIYHQLTTIGKLLPEDANVIISKVKCGLFPTGLTFRQQIILGWL